MRPSNEGTLTASDVETIGVLFGASGEDDHFLTVDPLPLVRTSYRLVTTPLLLAGEYFFTLTLFVTGAASGTVVTVDVEVDGVSLGDVLSAAGTPGGGFILSGSATQSWGESTHTINYLAWQSDGPNTAAAISARTTWERRR